MKKFLACIIPVLFFIFHLSAVEKKFLPVVAQNTLPNTSITTIETDSYGFIWVGTEYGLSRFDGYNFYSFFHKDEGRNEIPGNQIKQLLHASDGNIWIACNKGIAYVNPVTLEIDQPFSTHAEFSKRIINVIYEDHFKNIWIGTDMGLYVISLRQHILKEIPVILGEKENINVTFISSDPDNNIWIAANAGYARIAAASCSEILKKEADILKIPQNQHISCFGIDEKGFLWSNDGNKLFCYDLMNDKSLSNLNLIAADIDGKTIYFPEENNLLIGTRWQGAVAIDYESSGGKFNVQRYWMDVSSMANMSNTVNAFRKDKWGNIWAGTKEGLYLLQRRQQTPFYNIQESMLNENTPSHQAISCYLQTADGKIWVGANNGINLFEWKSRRNNEYSITRYSDSRFESSGDIIQSMTSLNDSLLLLGTKNGVMTFDVRTKKYDRDFYLNDYLKENNRKVCKTIWKDDDQMLWLGFADDGTVLLHNLETRKTIEVSTFKGKDVWSIVRHNDKIWVGTRSGLYSFRYKDNKFSRLISYFKEKNSPHSIPDEWVTKLYVDHNNRLWVGTANGLSFYNPEDDTFTCIQLNITNDVAYISGITEDNDHNIWAAAIKGIFKVDTRHKASFFELSDGKFSTVNYAFGSLLAQDGTVFLGGINGITYFKPNEIVKDSVIYPVYFTDIQVNGKSISEGENINNTPVIRLKYNQNQIQINFSTLFYANPYHIRYSYRLSRQHSDWVNSDQRNYTSFSNLSPGRYTFEVRSTNLLGFTQDKIKKLELEIMPPFWKTWWAYLIYFIILISIIIIIYRFLMERNRLSQEERNNLWRFQLYTNITHGFKAPLMLMEGPLNKLLKEEKELTEKEKSELLHVLQRNTKRLTHLINQFMEFRRIDRGRSILHLSENNISELLHDVYSSFLPIAVNKKIALKFESGEELPGIIFDYEKIETVLFNLFSNALKFTEQGGRITLKAEKDSSRDCVWISLQDTGIGIAPQHLDKIFERFWQEKNNRDSHVRGTGIGLSLAKDFVELHHGEMTVVSKPGKGSTFSFSLPLGKEHFKGQTVSPYVKEEKSYTADFVEIEQGLTLQEGYPLEEADDNLPLIILVDDDTEILSFLQKELSKEFRIKAFTGTQNIFSEIVKSNPALVISDVIMEGREEGFRLCKLIKKDIITSHIPVILMTGLESEDKKLSGYEVGADAYIRKPVDVAFLMVRIKQLLSNREKYREKVKMDIIVNPKEISVTSVDEKFLISVMNIIEEYMDDTDFSIEDFAREMSMSKTLLNSKLQALSGMSTNEFVKSVRLKRAANLLLTNAYSISEISYMVGFSSPKYFSTSFKKYFNITPKEYIERNHP